MPEFICNDTTYEIGSEMYPTIGLPVTYIGLPETIEVAGHTLLLKDEHHISLVSIGKIAEKLHLGIPDFVASVTRDFCAFTARTPLTNIVYRDEFKFCEWEERKSLIIMCDIPNLNAFFDEMNAKYNIAAEYPPTHVTLYTLQPNAGFWLIDQEDTDTLTQPVPRPDAIPWSIFTRDEEKVT